MGDLLCLSGAPAIRDSIYTSEGAPNLPIVRTGLPPAARPRSSSRWLPPGDAVVPRALDLELSKVGGGSQLQQLFKIDINMLYFIGWYIASYYYTLNNKLACCRWRHWLPLHHRLHADGARFYAIFLELRPTSAPSRRSTAPT